MRETTEMKAEKRKEKESVGSQCEGGEGKKIGRMQVDEGKGRRRLSCGKGGNGKGSASLGQGGERTL